MNRYKINEWLTGFRVEAANIHFGVDRSIFGEYAGHVICEIGALGGAFGAQAIENEDIRDIGVHA